MLVVPNIPLRVNVIKFVIVAEIACSFDISPIQMPYHDLQLHLQRSLNRLSPYFKSSDRGTSIKAIGLNLIYNTISNIFVNFAATQITRWLKQFL